MLHSLTTHGFWLALRVFKMSFVSILDLSSDVYIVIKYMNEPRTSGYGVSLLFCIVLCLMLQTLTTSLQMARKPGRIPLELCFIWMGVKPAVDSYRVAVGKEIEKWEAFDSKLVHTCTKMDEMIAESIPGCILQIYALFRVIEDGSPVSKAAVGSILVSAVTTGLASKNISWNFDDDPTCRAKVPDFYGYLPSSDWKRTGGLRAQSERVPCTCSGTASATSTFRQSTSYQSATPIANRRWCSLPIRRSTFSAPFVCILPPSLRSPPPFVHT